MEERGERKAAGIWQVTLPESQSPFASRVRGGSGPALGEPRSDAERADEIAAFLKPGAVKPERARVEREQPQPLIAAAPAPVAKAPEPVSAPAAEPAQPAAEPPLLASNQASSSDIERYAARDATSKESQNYRGGDAVIVISATTLIIILLIIIIILWLT